MPRKIPREVTHETGRPGHVPGRVPLAAVLAVLLIGGWAAAQDEPPQGHQFNLRLLDAYRQPLLQAETPLPTPKPLTLQGALERALENNLDIRVSRFDPAVRLADVVQAEAAFDATLFGSAQYEKVDRDNLASEFFERQIITENGRRNVTFPTEPFRQSWDYNYGVGLRKRLPTGAEIELAQLLRRFRNVTDEDLLYYRTFNEYDLQLRLRQPLLRDFGVDVNRATIHASRNNYDISRQQFQLEVVRTAQEVEQNYWSLVASRQQALIFLGLLNTAEQTKEKLDRRLARDTSTEVYMQAEALIQRARAGLVSALSAVRQQQDRLLESLNDPTLPLEAELEILPEDEPTSLPYTIDLNEARTLALQIRPEIIAQRLSVDNAEIALSVAQNRLLPRLDLVLQQDVTGAGRDNNGAWSGQWDGDTVSYVAGLSFEVPLGNRAAEAGKTRAQHEYRQESLRLASVADLVNAELNISVRRVRDGYREIEARLDAARAEMNTLNAYLAMDRAEQGTTPGFLDRKLRAQERAANALLAVAQAKLQYNVALVDFQRARGTLLRYNNIKLAEADD